MIYLPCRERPPEFTLDPRHEFAQGLVFFGGGRFSSTTHYHDSSLFGNHGTLGAMEPESDWVFDTTLNRFCISVDGTTESVTVPYALSLFPPDVFSIAFWANSAVTDYSANAYCLAQYQTGGNLRQWGVYVPSASDDWRIITSSDGTANGTAIPSVPKAVQIGWHHLAYVVTNSTKAWAFYYDGAFVETMTASYTFINKNSHMTIGGLTASNGFNGKVADPLLIGRALSTSEISALADPSNVMLSGLILPPRRRLWAVSGGAPPATIVPRIMHHRRLLGVS